MRFLDHTQRRITDGRTPLDEWSARRRDLYLTTHNTHNRQISMAPVGIETTISAGERPQTNALNRAAIGTGSWEFASEIAVTGRESISVMLIKCCNKRGTETGELELKCYLDTSVNVWRKREIRETRESKLKAETIGNTKHGSLLGYVNVPKIWFLVFEEELRFRKIPGYFSLAGTFTHCVCTCDTNFPT